MIDETSLSQRIEEIIKGRHWSWELEAILTGLQAKAEELLAQDPSCKGIGRSSCTQKEPWEVS